MAEENRDWGYRWIQGALSNLGHEIARSTISCNTALTGCFRRYVEIITPSLEAG
jgi:hypothetical protein